MSKTQEKRAQRLAQAADFVKQRRELTLAMFEQNFDIGMKIYQDNKDTMSVEDITLLEAEIESARKAMEEYKEKWLQ
jgi:cob(I)alamin adenosyltransferase